MITLIEQRTSSNRKYLRKYIIAELSELTKIATNDLAVGSECFVIADSSTRQFDGDEWVRVFHGESNGDSSGDGGNVDLSAYLKSATAESTYQKLISGKSLSTNDFTNSLKTKLESTDIFVLSNYLTKLEVEDLFNLINTFETEKVATVEEVTQSNILYFVGTAIPYDEYMLIDGTPEKIGSTTVDLSNYYTKSQSDNKFVVKVADKGLSTNDLTNELVEIITNISTVYATLTDLDSKVDKDGNKKLSTNDFTNAYKTMLDTLTTTYATKETVNNKVDIVEGKNLSSNDFTNYYKNYIQSLIDGGVTGGDTDIDLSAYLTIENAESEFVKKDGNKVLSTHNFTTAYKTQLDELPTTYVNNTDLSSKLSTKVDKIQGKTLTTNDFSNDYKQKIDDTDIFVSSSYYNKSAINDLFNDIATYKEEIVATVEEVTTPKTLYFVGAESPYEEYIVVNGKPEKIGETNIDLSSYLKKETASQLYVTKEDGKSLTSNDFTNNYKTKIDTLNTTYVLVDTYTTDMTNKVNVVEGKSLSTNDFTNNYKTIIDNINETYALKTDLTNKVDMVENKGLSTNDFTNSLKTKLESLSNYDDTDINGLITTLSETVTQLLERVTTLEENQTSVVSNEVYQKGYNY